MLRKIETKNWKDFQIGELFQVVKGTRLTKADMRPGKLRFIGSSSMRNGWTSSIGNNECVHPANTLTVCYNGSVGETFYQDKPFWASDDVNVLYPNFEMNEYIALFIAPLIKVCSQKYNFTDKWKKEVMETAVIPLPVNSEGTPDYDYMEKYMRRILQCSEKAVNKMSKILEIGGG